MPKIFYAIIGSILILIAIFTFTQPSDNSPSSTEDLSATELSTEHPSPKKDYPILVLDAGHGGFDPGKVGVHGELEKDINLAIVKKLQTLLEDEGFTIYLTRDSDKILAPANSTSKKKDDMIARIEKITEINPAFTISIHQNSFPEGKYRGTQAFYAKTNGSRELAEHIQRTVSQTLQPENRREAKPISDSVYLMNHVHCRAVLIECGFLTNQEEACLLQTDAYQRKLASVISAGWLSERDKHGI